MRAAGAVAIDAAAEAGARGRDGAPLAAPVVEVVDARDVDQHLEAQLRVVAQRGDHVDEIRRGDIVLQIHRQRRAALHLAGKPRFNAARGLFDVLAHPALTFEAKTDVRWIFFCSWMMP